MQLPSPSEAEAYFHSIGNRRAMDDTLAQLGKRLAPSVVDLDDLIMQAFALLTLTRRATLLAESRAQGDTLDWATGHLADALAELRAAQADIST